MLCCIGQVNLLALCISMFYSTSHLGPNEPIWCVKITKFNWNGKCRNYIKVKEWKACAYNTKINGINFDCVIQHHEGDLHYSSVYFGCKNIGKMRKRGYYSNSRKKLCFGQSLIYFLHFAKKCCKHCTYYLLHVCLSVHI
jgi:hypothetical protein